MNGLHVRISAIRASRVKSVGLDEAPDARRTCKGTEPCRNRWERIPGGHLKSTGSNIKVKGCLLQTQSVCAALVLQHLNAPLGNAIAQCIRPYLCALRWFLAPNGGMELGASTNKTPNVLQEPLIAGPELTVLPNRSARANATQSCSTLLDSAPDSSVIQPHPRRQLVKITAPRPPTKEMTPSI